MNQNARIDTVNAMGDAAAKSTALIAERRIGPGRSAGWRN